jgi:UDP-N-acetylmuramoylalanine--D-glutamate ligase
MERVPSIDGRQWVNDALATVPEACVLALETLPRGEVTVLLGGADRGQDFSVLAQYLRERPDVRPILFGTTAHQISTTFSREKIDFEIAEGFEDALQRAASITSTGATILFSPAAATEPPQKDYQERANMFRTAARDAS